MFIDAVPLVEISLVILSKIKWLFLSKNPNAIHLFAQLDREKMREKCKEFARELLSYVLHPARLMRLASTFVMDLEEYMEQLI